MNECKPNLLRYIQEPPGRLFNLLLRSELFRYDFPRIIQLIHELLGEHLDLCCLLWPLGPAIAFALNLMLFQKPSQRLMHLMCMLRRVRCHPNDLVFLLAKVVHEAYQGSVSLKERSGRIVHRFQ